MALFAKFILFFKNLRFIRLLIANRFYIYGIIISAALCFAAGFHYGWKIKSSFDDIENLKVVEDNIDIREKQNAISNRNYDSDGFRSNVLRRGKL